MNYQKVYITDKPSPSKNQPPPRPKATYKRKLETERYPPIYIENIPNEFNVSPPKMSRSSAIKPMSDNNANKFSYKKLINEGKPKPLCPPKTYLNTPKQNQYTKLVNEKPPKPQKPPKTYESTQHYKSIKQIYDNPTFNKKLPKGWVKFT